MQIDGWTAIWKRFHPSLKILSKAVWQCKGGAAGMGCRVRGASGRVFGGGFMGSGAGFAGSENWAGPLDCVGWWVWMAPAFFWATDSHGFTRIGTDKNGRNWPRAGPEIRCAC